MTTELLNRIVSFVQNVANDCKGCLVKSDINCNSCHSLIANSILLDINANRNQKIDYSYAGRVAKIITLLKCSNRPLTFKEINLGKVCSQQLKFYTLKSLIRRGIIQRKNIPDKSKKRFAYYLKHK